MKNTLLPVLIGMCFCCDASAIGFQPGQQGLKQMAFGACGVAGNWDAASLFYNPAGMSYLSGKNLYLGSSFINNRVQYVPYQISPNAYENKATTQVPISLFYVQSLKRDSSIKVGLGIYNFFSESINWEDNWIGKYRMQSYQFNNYCFQPSISKSFGTKLNVGLGLIASFSNSHFKKAIDIQNQNEVDGEKQQDTKGIGWGFNAGIQYQMFKHFSIGFSYRSAIRLNYYNITTNYKLPESVASIYSDYVDEYSRKLPSQATLGINYSKNKWQFEIDATLNTYSVYESSKFDLNTLETMEFSLYHATQTMLSMGFGMAYQSSQKLQLLAGFAFCPEVIKENFQFPGMYDTKKYSFSTGASFKFNDKINATASLQYVYTDKTAIENRGFNGDYQLRSFNPAIGLNYSF